MSHTMVPMNIVSAIVKTEDKLGKGRTWSPVNEEQTAFLSNFLSKRETLKALSPAELRAWIDTNAESLNKVLADEGFDIKLDDFGPEGFGVVSILDLLVEWIVAGKKSTIYTEHTDYPGVRFAKSHDDIDGEQVCLFETFTSNVTPSGVALLHTKSGDKVFMTVAGHEAEGFELMNAIDEIRGSKLTPDDYAELSFPMIDFDRQIDISWLVGMETVSESGKGYHVAQALQQTKFKMNQLGAHLKDAVAIGMRCTSIRMTRSLNIDKPFYLWIERAGMDVPILYAYFDEQNWKDPGNLDL